MLEIKLTAGEARAYKEKFEFKSVVQELKEALDANTDLDGEVESDKLEEITDIAAKQLGVVFEVDPEVFFMTDWSIIEWWTSIVESYEYVCGAVSVYKHLK